MFFLLFFCFVLFFSIDHSRTHKHTHKHACIPSGIRIFFANFIAKCLYLYILLLQDYIIVSFFLFLLFGKFSIWIEWWWSCHVNIGIVNFWLSLSATMTTQSNIKHQQKKNIKHRSNTHATFRKLSLKMSPKKKMNQLPVDDDDNDDILMQASHKFFFFFLSSNRVICHHHHHHQTHQFHHHTPGVLFFFFFFFFWLHAIFWMLYA